MSETMDDPGRETPQPHDPRPIERGPEPIPGGNRSRLALAAFMTVAGIAHFLAPDFYRRIVPRWIGHDAAVVAWSGVAEILGGTLVAIPRTQRVGAWLSLITLIVVYPANLNMAIEAGRPRDAFSIGVWLRLPLQFPMWAWAFRRATR